MANQAVSFFFAGNDTTTFILSLTLCELAINKNIQHKLRSEISQIFQKYNNITLESLQESKYLDMVLSGM